MLGALSRQTRGTVSLADGEPAAALGPLREALGAWQALEAPYEVARVRALLSVAFWQVDDRERAAMECDAARQVFEALNASPALAQLDRLLSEFSTPVEPPPVPGPDVIITARQLTVLRLVAAGRTNRDIGVELSISEKTVERHLGDIFTKLGVTNRTAATARAYDRGLL